jgi:hypothetical protein
LHRGAVTTFHATCLSSRRSSACISRNVYVLQLSQVRPIIRSSLTGR